MQSPLILAYNNLIDLNQTITYSTQAKLQPVSYMANDFRGVKGRFGGKTSEYIQVAFASGAQPFNCLGIIGSNLSATGTITLSGSTDGFVASNDTLVDAQVLQSNQSTGALNDVNLFTCDTFTNYTSVRITFKDPGNSASYIECARVFVGTYIQPKVNYTMDWSAGQEDLSIVNESINFVQLINVKSKRRVPNLPFVKVPPEDLYIWETFFETVGCNTPFIVALNPDSRPEQTYWCRITKIPQPTENPPKRFSFTLALVEWL